MASNARMVAREVSRFIDNTLSPEALGRSLAAMARAERDSLISQGRASPQYTTFVDGLEGAREETVKPTGVIRYEFGDMTQVLGFVLGYLIQNSRRKTGEFQKAWAMAVNGRPFTGDLASIPPRAKITIVNLAPYSRKIETGAMPKMRMGRAGIEMARQAGMRKFPHYDFGKAFVDLPHSFGSLTNFEVPYVLRGDQRSFAAKYSRHIAANKGRAVRTNRLELMRGEVLAYPALEFQRRSD